MEKLLVFESTAGGKLITDGRLVIYRDEFGPEELAMKGVNRTALRRPFR